MTRNFQDVGSFIIQKYYKCSYGRSAFADGIVLRMWQIPNPTESDTFCLSNAIHGIGQI